MRKFANVFDEQFPAWRGPVLVVDDDPDMCQTILLTLQIDGLAVEAATSREQAIDLARRSRPSVVTLDLNLKGCSGDQVAEEVEAVVGRSVPLVLISGDDDVDLVAQRIGATAYLRKPFMRGDLLHAVHLALAHRPEP